MKRAVVLALFVVLATGCPPPPNPPATHPAWECSAGPYEPTIYRTRTPGGWLVSDGTGVCYVPDPDRAWLRPAPEAGR